MCAWACFCHSLLSWPRASSLCSDQTSWSHFFINNTITSRLSMIVRLIESWIELLLLTPQWLTFQQPVWLSSTESKWVVSHYILADDIKLWLFDLTGRLKCVANCYWSSVSLAVMWLAVKTPNVISAFWSSCLLSQLNSPLLLAKYILSVIQSFFHG